MNGRLAWMFLLPALAGSTALADDFSALCADRVALERVYYEHRLGTKPPFEQVMPRDLVEKLERDDLRKEAVLKSVYGVEITPAMIDAEIRRIDSTTRAPEMLAELKAALGHDPARFARSVARPIVVEHELRARFENDDRLHAAQRQLVEATRAEMIGARKDGESASNLLSRLKESPAGSVREVTWLLTPRPDESSLATNAPHSSAPEAHVDEARSYFGDLAPELQRVLRVQLQKPGDVSAVVETPTGFMLFLAVEKTDAALGAASLAVPKRSYDQWLADQTNSVISHQ